jgi:uncharacterized protein (DUF58 family)
MARLDGLDVLSRKMLQGKLQGERRSKRRGQSVEFAEHRPYVVGDDLRFVDWNVYGRLDQLFLKLFLEELDLSVHLMVDLTSSMAGGDPPKDRFVRKLAAALGYVSLVNNNRLTVSTFADGLTGQLAHCRGRNYLSHLAELLLSTPAEGLSDFDLACRQAVGGRLGTGVAIIISDMLYKEGYESGLRRLISRNYDLCVIQVLSPQELNPEVSGDLKLLDIEDGDAAEVTVNAALMDYYKRAVRGYCNDIREFCTRRGATYVLTDSGRQVEPLVLNYLRRVGLLR